MRYCGGDGTRWNEVIWMGRSHSELEIEIDEGYYRLAEGRISQNI
ncbi:hypothetical protein ACFL6S_17990 [Candidatus Poribacteria bacterium]